MGAISMAAVAAPFAAMAASTKTKASASAQLPGAFVGGSLLRSQHTATVLRDGRVLVCGGVAILPAVQDGELLPAVRDQCTALNPYLGTTQNVSAMRSARCRHAAVLLQDGRVVVFGGLGNSNALDSVEVYSPVTNTWTGLPPMRCPRFDHTATIQFNTIHLIGGSCDNGAVDSVEIYSLAARPAATTP